MKTQREKLQSPTLGIDICQHCNIARVNLYACTNRLGKPRNRSVGEVAAESRRTVILAFHAFATRIGATPLSLSKPYLTDTFRLY